MTSKISISIIEDNLPIRNNVSKYISFAEDLEMNKEFGSIEEYIIYASQNPKYVTDIILLDIGLPGKSGLEGIPLILESHPSTDIVMLTTYEEEEVIVKAMCLGAVGYISKKSTLEEIADGLRIVSNGGSYMSPMIAREIINHFGKPKEKKDFTTILSLRQLDVLKRLVEGESYKRIGADMGISFETVKSHIKNIYRALHVNNKAGAIAKYLSGDLD